MVLEKLDFHMQKKEIGPLSNPIQNNSMLFEDQRP